MPPTLAGLLLFCALAAGPGTALSPPGDFLITNSQSNCTSLLPSEQSLISFVPSLCASLHFVGIFSTPSSSPGSGFLLGPNSSFPGAFPHLSRVRHFSQYRRLRLKQFPLSTAPTSVTLSMLWAELCPQERHVEVLILSTSECDLIWK